MTGLTTITENSVPRLPKGVRLKHDKTRERWVILAPERMFVLDEIANAVMQEVDGEREVETIVDALADAYGAPRDQVLTDVLAMLQDFADKGALEA